MSSTIIEEEKTIVVLPNKHRKQSLAKGKFFLLFQSLSND